MIFSFPRDGHIREQRLCRQTGPSVAPPSSPGGFGEWLKNAPAHICDLFLWLGEKATWLTAELAEQFGRLVVGLPISVVKGLKDALQSVVPEKEKVIAMIHAATNFFAEAPETLRKLVEEICTRETLDYQTLMNLVDPLRWIDAFNHPDILGDPTKGIPAKEKITILSKPYGPYELLLQEEKEWRKTRYRDFVKSMFSQEIRGDRAFRHLFVNVDTMVQEKENILDAARLTLGGEKPPPGPLSKNLAQRALRDRYFTLAAIPVAGIGVVPLPLHKAGLKAEYEQLQRRYPSLTEAQLLSPHFLETGLPPSFLRGALRLGVLDEARLKALKQSEEKRKAGKAEAASEIGPQLDLAFLKREAQTVEQVWYGLNGIEKLLLIAGAIYAASKWRNLALGLAAVYFGRKFYFNDPNPLNTFGEILRGSVGKVQSLGEGFLSKFGYEPEVSPREYGDLMLSFLHEDVREQLNQAAVGFSILARVPLHSLADSFKVDAMGEGGELDIADGEKWNKDSALYRAIQKEIKNQKLDRKRVEEFFVKGANAPRNREEVGDALTHVFYMLAAKEPENDDRRKIVEAAADRLLAGQGYDEITDPTARKAYRQLVLEGQELAGEMKVSFYDLIQELRELRGKPERRVARVPRTVLPPSRIPPIAGVTAPLVTPPGASVTTPSSTPSTGSAAPPLPTPPGSSSTTPLGTPPGGTTTTPSPSPSTGPSTHPSPSPPSGPSTAPSSTPPTGPVIPPRGTPPSP